MPMGAGAIATAWVMAASEGCGQGVGIDLVVLVESLDDRQCPLGVVRVGPRWRRPTTLLGSIQRLLGWQEELLTEGVPNG